MELFRNALDLAEDWIQRMLERSIDARALRRAHFLEVAVNTFARLGTALAVAAEILDNFLTRENGFGDVVEHGPRRL